MCCRSLLGALLRGVSDEGQGAFVVWPEQNQTERAYTAYEKWVLESTKLSFALTYTDRLFHQSIDTKHPHFPTVVTRGKIHAHLAPRQQGISYNSTLKNDNTCGGPSMEGI